MNPAKVDVNVHPAKLEVRFQEENKVFQAVYHAIKDILLKSELVKDPVKEIEENKNRIDRSAVSFEERLRNLRESKKENKNIVSIGRLSHEKGFLDLIDVFSLINKEDNECILHIIGDGEEKTKIEAKINELNLKDNVILYGYKDKEFIREKLNDMSLYLMTSYEESFGLVLLEAAAFGIPAIAFSSAEGATEIIKDDVSGYIINNRNKEEMKEKALELLNDKQKLALFGHEARLNAEDYSYDSVKEKWLSIINDILN